MYTVYIVTGEADNANESNSPLPPRTKKIRTKYGQVQGRIFDLNKQRAEQRAGKISRMKEGETISNQANHGGGRTMADGDMSEHLPRVAIFYGIPYATPPVGSNR